MTVWWMRRATGGCREPDPAHIGPRSPFASVSRLATHMRISNLSVLSRLAVACVGLLLIAFTLAATDASAGFAHAQQGHGSGQGGAFERRFTVTHGPAVTQMVTAGSTGHQLGDLRVLPAMPIADTSGAILGRLDAQLVTTSIDYPVVGDEVRMSVLNFVFGEGNANLAGSADQLQVSGSGYYPSSQSTIPVGQALVRPITGGSGAYAGASGWARTEHLADNTWRHTFFLMATPRR